MCSIWWIMRKNILYQHICKWFLITLFNSFVSYHHSHRFIFIKDGICFAALSAQYNQEKKIRFTYICNHVLIFSLHSTTHIIGWYSICMKHTHIHTNSYCRCVLGHELPPLIIHDAQSEVFFVHEVTQGMLVFNRITRHQVLEKKKSTIIKASVSYECFSPNYHFKSQAHRRRIHLAPHWVSFNLIVPLCRKYLFIYR